MPYLSRLLFLIAAVLAVAAIFWPVSGTDAVTQARQLAGYDRVIVFTTDWCGYCRRLRGDLERAGIAFTERNVEQSSQYHRAWQLLGGRGVPLTLVGDEVVKSYAPARIIELARAP